MAMDPSLDPNAAGGDPFFQQYGGGTGAWQSQPDAQGQTGLPAPPVVPAGTTPATPGATTPPTSSAAPQITNPSDPAQVRAWYAWRASQPGADPILQTPGGIDYYTKQTLDNGGLTDTNYWSNKSTLAAYGGAVGANGGNYGGGQIPLGQTGSLAQGWNGQFQAPSAADAANTPGYQFTLHQGIDALDGSAAARGTVLGGGHAKAVLDYATGLADSTYQQSYQNALGEYGQAYNIFRNNGNDLFDRYYKVGQMGTDAAVKATS